MELTEAEKIKTEEDRIRFLDNCYEAINYASLPKRVQAQVNRVKFNFYKKYGIKLGCKEEDVAGRLQEETKKAPEIGA